MIPNLSANTSATSGVGPSSIGANFTPTFNSPFVVGDGSSASATSETGNSGSQTQAYVILGVAVLLCLGAGFMVLQSSRR